MVVDSSVMVVIEVSDEGDGHERSGKSSWRFTFAGAPQPERESPGCLFPANLLMFIEPIETQRDILIIMFMVGIRTLTSDHN